MSQARWWKALLAIAMVIALIFLVSVVGTLIGATRPEHVAYAYQAHLSGTPREIWARLRLPDKLTQVRESPSGSRYEAAPNDTSGTLVLLYAPDSLMVTASYFANASVVTIQTFAPEGDGTLARVQTRA